MARKTFISYKYSEAKKVRDTIIKKLGDDSKYYQGEASDSPNLTDKKTETIKTHLKDMIHGTSVLIVVISPNMKASDWIDWEISYALKEITREDKTSRTNGIIGVIQKVNGSYDWLITEGTKDDGVTYITHDKSKMYPIINENMHNSTPPIYGNKKHELWDWDKGSYISLIKEEMFLKDPNNYIERAYDKIDKKIGEKGKYKINREL